MTRLESIVQPITPTEEEMRRDYLFFRVEVGTPWDNDAHIIERCAIPRAKFILDGSGALAEAICTIGWAIENFVRTTMIPAAIAIEEERQRDAAHQEPADTV